VTMTVRHIEELLAQRLRGGIAARILAAEIEYIEWATSRTERAIRKIEMSVAHIEDVTPATVTYQNILVELDPYTIEGTCRHLDN
jgi:hypothetical protein